MKKKSTSQSAFFAAFLVVLSVQLGHAGSATWKMTPQDGNWNNIANWAPPTVPNGPNDTAHFGFSNVTNVTISSDIEVNSIVFMPGASPFTISPSSGDGLTISGVGITNNSGITQNFETTNPIASINFTNSATAGNLTVYTMNGGTQSGQAGGTLTFHDTSTAAFATLIANAGTNGGDAGVIQFLDSSTGGTASVILDGGTLDLSAHIGQVTIGSLQNIPDRPGTSLVFLGSNKIVTGTGTHVFSGTISGIGGSVARAGTGTLTLGGANTYTGHTTVEGGTLLLRRNGDSSQTGTGNVTVTAGILGGDGIAGGNVTIGGGPPGPRAELAPGLKLILLVGKFFTTKGNLTFKSDGDYDWQINSDDLSFGMVIARGVRIAPNAQFLASDIGTGAFPQGMVLTIIKNNSQLPIIGTFSHLPDGTLLTVGANTLLISYHGGSSGRDMTGTVQ